MRTYKVSTMHKGVFGNDFIVPVDIDADSPDEAASQRFDILAEHEKQGVRALLVQPPFGRPSLYYPNRTTVFPPAIETFKVVPA